MAASSATALPYAVDSAVGVVNRIKARLPEMSEAMSQIARFLIEKPQAPLELSIKELAEETGASAATITRFCRLIGYTGYAAFRVSVAAELGRSDARESWKTDIGRAFGPDDAPQAVLSTLVNAHSRSLRETADALDLRVMKNLARQIALCEHLDVYGIGGSAVMASELQSRLYRIGIPVHHWSEVHAGLVSASRQNAKCIAIGISNTGRTEETIEMLRQARIAGATTIALTNQPDSPLTEVADFQIITSVHEHFLQPDDLSAKHGQLLVLDLLYLLVAQENFPSATTNLAASAVAVAQHRRPGRISSAAEQMAQLTPHSVERKRKNLG